MPFEIFSRWPYSPLLFFARIGGMHSLHLPRLSYTNTRLLIACGAIFLLQIGFQLGGSSLLPFLGLSAAKLFSGHLYQLATFPLVSQGLLELLFNGLVLWFFGSELEGLWGRYRYWQFTACTLAGQALFYVALMSLFFSRSVLFAYPLGGLSGLCAAICVAYGVLFPNRIVYLYLFPVRAKWFVAIIVLIGLYQALPSQGGVYAWAQLAAMTSGFGWMWAVSQVPGNWRDWFPRHWRNLLGFKSRPRGQAPPPSRKSSGKPHLKVVHTFPPDDESPSNKTYH